MSTRSVPGLCKRRSEIVSILFPLPTLYFHVAFCSCSLQKGHSHMTFSPRISIVMPCYLQAPYLEEAVRSVLDQRDVEVELIVMDPGSTDGSRELLQTLKKEYGDCLVLHFAPDDGQSDAINRGMTLA